MESRSLGYHLDNTNNNFNMIRLLAAFAVIYGHTTAITGNGPADIFLQYIGYKFIGGVAVDIFFLISGFFITFSALNSNSLKYFFVSRILRIYPALIVCVVLTVFLLGPILSTSNEYWSNKETWHYLWTNMTALDTAYFLPGVFTTLHDKAINGSLWSIAIEIKLYLLVFIIAFLKVIYNKPFFNFLFFSILIIGYLNQNTFTFLFQHSNHIHVAMMFLIGSFIYINRFAIVINPFILLFLLFFAAATHNTPGFGIAYVILLSYIVFYFAFAPGLALFNKIGDYSYGVYLYGWPSQQLIILLFSGISNSMHTFYSILLALLFSILSWHLVEDQALKMKSYFK